MSEQESPAQQVGNRLWPAVPAYRVVSMEAAEQYAAILPPRVFESAQRPAEVSWIAHRSIQRNEKALKRGKVVALVIVHIVDIDIAKLVLDRFHERSFVCVRAVRHRTVEASAGDACKRG